MYIRKTDKINRNLAEKASMRLNTEGCHKQERNEIILTCSVANNLRSARPESEAEVLSETLTEISSQ